jgi:hypothetical protein
MGIEALDHPFYGAIDELLRILRLHIVFFNLPEHFRKDLYIFINVSGPGCDMTIFAADKNQSSHQQTYYDYQN